MAWTYCSKETVAAIARVDADILRDEWSDQVESLIADYEGFATIGSTTIITEEAHDGNGSNRIFVKKPPIVSVTSVQIGSISPTTLSSTAYKVYDQYIQLVNSNTTSLAEAFDSTRNVFPHGTQNVLITYVSGLATVPPRIELCAAVMIGEFAKVYRKGGSDNSLKFSGSGITQGERTSVAADKGLLATLRSHMENTLRHRARGLG